MMHHQEWCSARRLQDTFKNLKCILLLDCKVLLCRVGLHIRVDNVKDLVKDQFPHKAAVPEDILVILVQYSKISEILLDGASKVFLLIR